MADQKYKKDLDRLFKSGEVPDRFKSLMEKVKDGADVDPERAAAIEGLRDAEDFRAFAKAAREYRKAGFDLPNNEDLLIKMLDLPDERMVQAVLAHILELHRKRGFDRLTPIRNRVATIRSVSEDPKTETLLAQIEEII